MTDSLPPDASDTEDVENDAVIGAAFRASLFVFVIGALPVIGFLIFLNLNKEKEQSTEAEVNLPQPRLSNEQQTPALPLADVTVASGIDFVHQTGRYGDKLLPETMGSGVAIFDFNNDRHLDVLLVNSKPWPWAPESGAAELGAPESGAAESPP
ncbi:MAG: hypothetical protein MI861_29380, partial [Pirellulales bacterium]|nr:hypothetical protein [Pirellulales bacterium]